jgi:hypothetical protein
MRTPSKKDFLKYRHFVSKIIESTVYMSVNTSVADPGCLSRIPDPTFSIPDPGYELSPSRIRTVSIPDPGSASKNLSILTQKKWFLSSRKYDPGCSSRIPDPDVDFYPSRIPDPGVNKKGTESRIRIRNTGKHIIIKYGTVSLVDQTY